MISGNRVFAVIPVIHYRSATGQPIYQLMRKLGAIRLVIVFGLLFVSDKLLTLAVDGLNVHGHVWIAGKPAAGAVIWLEAPDAPRPARRVVLDQRNLSFSPPVLAISTGSTVRFPNNDRVLHNVFSFRDGKKFDLGLYPSVR